jgi:uncharacterized protein (DUF433 family)
MQLEDYFDFLGPSEIRIKGHRIGIEHVIERYHDGDSAEQIGAAFPGLSLEKIYATITYYLHNQAEIDAYLARQDALMEQSIREYEAQDPPPVVKRLRALKEQRERERILTAERELARQRAPHEQVPRV